MQRQFMQTLVEIIDQIKKEQTIHREQLQALLETTDEQAVSYLRDTARKVADDIYQYFYLGLQYHRRNNAHHSNCGLLCKYYNTVQQFHLQTKV